MKNEFKKPPLTSNENGEERTVGYELEFTGIEMGETAQIVAGLYGGETEQLSSFEYTIRNTKLGEFALELDARLLLDREYEKVLLRIGIDPRQLKKRGELEESLKDLASSVVPYEIITPPVKLSEMPKLNRMVQSLRIHQAKGTGSSVVYAFGLHLNPEVPETNAESLLNHLRAYVLLDPWIRVDADIDLSRRLTPYINKFESRYLELILDPDYRPGLETLIRDYIGFENTRNRSLDMLPVFMHLKPGLTSSLLDDTRTSARPTFHYRLPNCSLENADWTLASEWNRWVLVEQLAYDEETLMGYCRAWNRLNRDSVFGFEKKWTELIQRFVNDDKTKE